MDRLNNLNKKIICLILFSIAFILILNLSFINAANYQDPKSYDWVKVDKCTGRAYNSDLSSAGGVTVSVFNYLMDRYCTKSLNCLTFAINNCDNAGIKDYSTLRAGALVIEADFGSSISLMTSPTGILDFSCKCVNPSAVSAAGGAEEVISPIHGDMLATINPTTGYVCPYTLDANGDISQDSECMAGKTGYSPSNCLLFQDNYGTTDDVDYQYYSPGYNCELKEVNVNNGAKIYEYNFPGTLKSEKYFSNPEWNTEYAYYDDGSLLSITLENSANPSAAITGAVIAANSNTVKTGFTYYSNGTIETKTDQIGSGTPTQTTYEWDSVNPDLIIKISAPGKKINYTYDSLGRLVRNDWEKTEYTFGISSIINSWLESTYDSADNIIAMEDDMGMVIDYSYNPKTYTCQVPQCNQDCSVVCSMTDTACVDANCESYTNTAGAVQYCDLVSFTFEDSCSYSQKETVGQGNTVLGEYIDDATGDSKNCVSGQAGSGSCTSSTNLYNYNTNGQLTLVEGVLKAGYNAQGQLTQIKHTSPGPENNRENYNYYTDGQVAQIVSLSEGRSQTLVYNALGEVVKNDVDYTPLGNTAFFNSPWWVTIIFAPLTNFFTGFSVKITGDVVGNVCDSSNPASCDVGETCIDGTCVFSVSTSADDANDEILPDQIYALPALPNGQIYLTETFYYTIPGDEDTLYTLSEFNEVVSDYESEYGNIEMPMESDDCYDSDDNADSIAGEDIFTYSYVKDNKEYYIDNCDTEDTNKLYEQYCGGWIGSSHQIRDVNCQYGCEAGACKSEPIVSTAEATCSDGIQNQDETGIDCGGPCAACVRQVPPAPPAVGTAIAKPTTKE